MGQVIYTIDSNLKAIPFRGWNPLNYNLLKARQIQPTITECEKLELCSMMKIQPAKTSADTLITQQSLKDLEGSMINSTSLSDLMDVLEMNNHPYTL